MRKTFHLSEVESYAYCPARYYFERKKNRGLDAKVTFDFKRRIFREFFRVRDHKTKNYSRLNSYVQEFQQHLIGKDNKMSPHLLAAYIQKAYEALWFSFGKKDLTVMTPKTMYLEMNSEFVVGVDVDAIFIERGTKVNRNAKGKVTSEDSKTILYFCVLVPPEEWHPINLSNRFDAMLCKEYLYPDLKVPGRKSQFEMLYFCPDNGRAFHLRYQDVIWTSQEKSRMIHLMENMKAGNFHRAPSQQRCLDCPMIGHCQPKNAQNKHHRECHSVIMEEPI